MDTTTKWTKLLSLGKTIVFLPTQGACEQLARFCANEKISAFVAIGRNDFAVAKSFVEADSAASGCALLTVQGRLSTGIHIPADTVVWVGPVPREGDAAYPLYAQSMARPGRLEVGRPAVRVEHFAVEDLPVAPVTRETLMVEFHASATRNGVPEPYAVRAAGDVFDQMSEKWSQGGDELAVRFLAGLPFADRAAVIDRYMQPYASMHSAHFITRGGDAMTQNDAVGIAIDAFHEQFGRVGAMTYDAADLERFVQLETGVAITILASTTDVQQRTFSTYTIGGQSTEHTRRTDTAKIERSAAKDAEFATWRTGASETAAVERSQLGLAERPTATRRQDGSLQESFVSSPAGGVEGAMQDLEAASRGRVASGDAIILPLDVLRDYLGTHLPSQQTTRELQKLDEGQRMMLARVAQGLATSARMLMPGTAAATPLELVRAAHALEDAIALGLVPQEQSLLSRVSSQYPLRLEQVVVDVDGEGTCRTLGYEVAAYDSFLWPLASGCESRHLVCAVRGAAFAEEMRLAVEAANHDLIASPEGLLTLAEAFNQQAVHSEFHRFLVPADDWTAQVAPLEEAGNQERGAVRRNPLRYVHRTVTLNPPSHDDASPGVEQ